MNDYGIDGLLDIINPTDAILLPFVEKEGNRGGGGKQHHDHYDRCFPTVLML